MCRCLTLRIFTHPAGTQLDTREFISVRSKPGSFSVVEIVTQQDRGIAPALIQALDKTLAVIGAQINQLTQIIQQLLGPLFKIGPGGRPGVVGLVTGTRSEGGGVGKNGG